MGQYISIATPDNLSYQTNKALERILEYLGQKYKENHNGAYLHLRSDFNVGLEYMNKKCKKNFKTTIRNLVFSRKRVTSFHTEYRDWKIHKTKAEKFFRVLHRELKKMEAPIEIWDLFNSLYNVIVFSFPISKKGEQIISYPYRTALNQAKNGTCYSNEEKKAIAEFEKTFPLFNDFYLEA